MKIEWFIVKKDDEIKLVQDVLERALIKYNYVYPASQYYALYQKMVENNLDMNRILPSFYQVLEEEWGNHSKYDTKRLEREQALLHYLGENESIFPDNEDKTHWIQNGENHEIYYIILEEKELENEAIRRVAMFVDLKTVELSNKEREELSLNENFNWFRLKEEEQKAIEKYLIERYGAVELLKRGMRTQCQVIDGYWIFPSEEALRKSVRRMIR